MGSGIMSCDPRIIYRVCLMTSTVSILVLVLCSASVTSLPNIRIQVNNENLQNPPYLLDAIKQVEKAEQGAVAAAATSNQNNEHGSNVPRTHQNDPNTGPSNAQPVASLSNNDRSNSANALAGANSGSSSGKPAANEADSVEGMQDLDPDSVLRLSPESIVGSSISELDAMQSPPVDHEISPMGQESREKNDFKQANNRHFQLDVTSSHLKRPSAPSSELIEEELSGESSQRATMIRHQVSNQETASGGTGAKSRISPSVASEEAALAQPSNGSPPVTELKEKIAASPPDTWEPSQVMQGVTNASLVPATVKRQYGHQTRTRITLGGGYQREQQPPLVNPSSSEYVENKPEKPVVPLERPMRDHQSSGSAVENSRVIQVPERIVLPVSVFTNQQSSSKGNVTIELQEVVRKRDKRCPSNGVTSMEHPTACDKYFLCEDGYSSEQVCPNGLMYGTRDIVRDFCVHRWQVVCGDKSIPNPISSPGCRWQNGIFNVQGSPKCTPDFYECTDGLFEVKKCTISGQVYDDKTKSCQYAEQVDCAQEALADFQCPTDDQSNTYWPFPRYFLNDRALIHCVSDKPQIIRCRDHERVDPEHLFCVPIDKSAPPVNEDGSPAEAAVSARRATTTQREKGKKVQKANTR